ncbi:MAG: hypothetical protein CMH55_04135 [Myxococcales bacterium]|nr:hypothetical protein [Myxococcales bacterium]|tara:strand:- start:239 stop:490 length:252 start_codon:yes stop_codon:yes gene_type:complete
MNLDWNHRPGMGKHMSLKAPKKKKVPSVEAKTAAQGGRYWLRCLGGLAIAGGSAYTFAQGGLPRQVVGVLGLGAGGYLCWSAQ